MKRGRILLSISITVLWFLRAPAAYADSAIGPPPPAVATPPSPVIITALRFEGTSTTGGAPLFAQLYNNSDDLVDMRGWRLVFSTENAAATLATFDSWLLPRGYVVAGDATISGADYTFALDDSMAQQAAHTVGRVVSIEPDDNFAAQSVGLPFYTYGAAQWLQRTQTSSGKYNVAGKATDFAAQNGTAQLYSGGQYTPALASAGLSITEILPAAHDCPPTASDLRCNDYIKLYNADSAPIDLANYRLRSNYGGTKSGSSNTFQLQGTLTPNTYLTIHAKDDGSPLSLLDNGGYVWIEDTFGLQIYDPVVQYPDGDSGSAWAFDGTAWRWTTNPQPLGANNFSAELPQTIEDSVVSLAPCDPGQERNPATNRCRSIASTAAEIFTPCKPGEERNPATNRCRAVLAASTTLEPCPAGQTRNPETNRCRKDQIAAIADVRDVAAATSPPLKLPLQWFIAAGVAIVALGYALYEWRQDIRQLRRTLRPRIAAFASQHLRFWRHKRRP